MICLGINCFIHHIILLIIISLGVYETIWMDKIISKDGVKNELFTYFRSKDKESYRSGVQKAGGQTKLDYQLNQ